MQVKLTEDVYDTLLCGKTIEVIEDILNHLENASKEEIVLYWKDIANHLFDCQLERYNKMTGEEVTTIDKIYGEFENFEKEEQFRNKLIRDLKESLGIENEEE